MSLMTKQIDSLDMGTPLSIVILGLAKEKYLFCDGLSDSYL